MAQSPPTRSTYLDITAKHLRSSEALRLAHHAGGQADASTQPKGPLLLKIRISIIPEPGSPLGYAMLFIDESAAKPTEKVFHVFRLFQAKPPKGLGDPLSDTQDDSLQREYLQTLEIRSFKTYRARESASNRLSKRAQAWTGALVAFSTSTTIASIGMLTDPDMYGTNGATLLVCLSILVLVVSLTTSNMDYPGRSRDMFLNYRKLQRISVEMEALRRQTTELVTATFVKKLSERYQIVLDETENHTTGDYYKQYSRSLPKQDAFYSQDQALLRKRAKALTIDRTVTFLPYATLVVPVILLVPLIAGLLT